MTLAIISHPDCLLHEVGSYHPERADRIKIIQETLATYPFTRPVRFHLAPFATREQLISAHDEDYVDWIFSVAPKEGYFAIDQDTIMNPFSLNAALLAAGAVPSAVDKVMKGEAQAAFCNARPPGHHAERDRAMGFCFFNNVAIGVMHAMMAYSIERVAIIDFDVHHGNGTQSIFEADERVMYCSSFEHPFYPGYDPRRDNAHILSVPLVAGTKGQEFREKVAAAWFQQLKSFKPELIFFSAGFDAHINDPLADLALTKADYVWLTTQIAQIAELTCGGKMVSVLEGGYDLQALAECVPLHVNAMQLSS